MGVDDARELARGDEVPQRLYPSGRGARADRHQVTRAGSDGLDPLDVLGGGDRTLDERQVVGPARYLAHDISVKCAICTAPAKVQAARPRS
jgi:hypothetical protein